MKTTATPLGPVLNPTSEFGVVDQHLPLVGYDMITEGGQTGYWPLFATTKSNLYVDIDSKRWVSAYDGKGAVDSVECESDEAIVGIRYKSHVAAGKVGSNLSPLPDIQCAKLESKAAIKAVEIDSVDKRTVRVDNATGDGTIKTAQSVIDVQQCMLKATKNFAIEQKGGTFNACYTHLARAGTSSSVPSGNVLLVEYLLSIKPDRKRLSSSSGKGPEMLQFMIQREPIDADSLFGTDDDTADKRMRAEIEAAQGNAVNKAEAQYKANWGDKAKSIEEIKNELGPTPWSSEKLIAGSAEFVSGSLLSGDKMHIVRGFTRSDDPSNPLAMICGSVYGCAHGTCKDDKCVCKDGFGGPACGDRLDPCGDNPCGDHGKCSEDWTLEKKFKCTCNEKWSGETCEETSNVCLAKKDGIWGSVDCGRGDCVPDTVNGSYTCECEKGWDQTAAVTANPKSGKCETRKVDCVGKWKSTLCDGSCNQKETFHIITAAEGEGAACSATDGDTRTSMCTGGQCKRCISRDCNRRGKCDEGLGKCTCEAGWKGDNCEQSTSQCATSLCNGHGNCNDIQSQCTCLNGWTSEPSATTSFCTVDPCRGCPPGRCNLDTGYCSCENDAPNPDYPACGLDGIVDCEGKWSAWSACTPTCERKRYFSIVTLPGPGGRACPKRAGEAETGKCEEGSCCSIKPEECKNGGEFIAVTCECRCRIGFQGKFCETSSSTADRVVTKEISVDAATMALLNTTERPEVTWSTVTVAPVAQAAEAADTDDKTMLYIYIGAGAGGLLLIAGAAYFLTKKKPAAPVTDPLLAGLVGMEGMDLTGMDLTALGLDANGNPTGGGNPM